MAYFVGYEEKNRLIDTHGDDWCKECHEHASKMGRAPGTKDNNDDGDDKYWEAYNRRWDELCPNFNPLTGRGYHD